jgi:hypothetical protein
LLPPRSGTICRGTRAATSRRSGRGEAGRGCRESERPRRDVVRRYRSVRSVQCSHHCGPVLSHCRARDPARPKRSRVRSAALPSARYVRQAGFEQREARPWYEVIGVVRNMGVSAAEDGAAQYAYFPATAIETCPLVFALRVKGDAAGFAPALRDIALAVDPGLRLEEVAHVHTASMGPMHESRGDLTASETCIVSHRRLAGRRPKQQAAAAARP